MLSGEKILIRLFRSLPDPDRQTLLAFAEFLAGRVREGAAEKVAEPLDIPRPEQESVVKAIKRLTATYPMLDRGKLLHETSSRMTEHLMHGKPASQVIDELEAVFSTHYQRFKVEQ